MAIMCACMQVLSGILGALIGAVAMTYIGLFYTGLTEELGFGNVPNHPGLLHSNPLLNNSLLILFFCFFHSLLARKWLKNLLSPLLSTSIYRQFFMFQSSFFIFLMGYGWTPQTTPTLWDIQSPPLRSILYGMCVFGGCLMAVSFFTLPVLEFFGIMEPLSQLTGNKKEKEEEEEEVELVTTGVYGLVRHPLYLSVLICTWFHPTMTLSRFMITAVVTIYVLMAVPLLEEPDLLELFGDKYRKYIKTTPMLLPLPPLSGSRKVANKEN